MLIQLDSFKEVILNLQYQQQRIHDLLLSSKEMSDDNFLKLNKISINLLNEILNFKKELDFLSFNK